MSLSRYMYHCLVTNCLICVYRTIDSVIYSYGKGKLKSFVGNPKTILDAVSVSVVFSYFFIYHLYFNVFLISRRQKYN